MRILALLALVGCVSNDASATFDPTAVTSGVYHVTAVMQNDTCSPPLAFGSGDVPMVATSKALAAFMIVNNGGSSQDYAYTLPVDTGYSLHSPNDGQRIDPCNDAPAHPGNSVTTDYTLSSADAAGFDVSFDRTYVIATACSFAPQASCHASYAFHYDLVDACPSSCLEADRQGHEICTCH